MKLLFMGGSLYPDDANSIIVRRLVKEMRDMGHEVHLLGTCCNARSCIGTNTSVMEHTFLVRDMNYSRKLLGFLSTNKRVTMINLILHPKYLLELLGKKIYINLISLVHLSNQYRIHVEALADQGDFDCLIAVSAPFFAVYGSAKSNRRKNFIHLQLDPYSSGYYLKGKRSALRRERFVCENAKHIFLTRLVYADYVKSELKKYTDKVSIFDFPCIRPIRNSHNIQRIEGSEIRLTYVGALYPDIRSPEYMLKLMLSIIRNHPNIILSIVGKAHGNTNQLLLKYKNELGDRLILRGELDRISAERAMLEADVLVNIGNSTPNQMPSKLLDYISTGRPILNIHKLDHCPTLAFMKRYALSCNVSESSVLDEHLIEQVYQFLVSSAFKTIDYHEIEEAFIECTPGFVARQILNVISPGDVSEKMS